MTSMTMSFPKEFSMIQNSLPSFSSTPQPDAVCTNPIMMRRRRMRMRRRRRKDEKGASILWSTCDTLAFSCMRFSGCQTDDFDSEQLWLSVKVLGHSSKWWGAWKTKDQRCHLCKPSINELRGCVSCLSAGFQDAFGCCLNLSTDKIVYSNNLYDWGPILVNTRPDEHDRLASKFLQRNFEQRSRRMPKNKSCKGKFSQAHCTFQR